MLKYYCIYHYIQWDTFFDQIQPIASTIPYMVAAGVAEVGKNITK